ncbi:cellulase family glycosylhydrolase [Humitalea sp. 24SJ18S-53]|uniref:cellulase family glycosylhydrolase n=1 Tax=Humitalea sp. 24SJ18S-53 TaxID=3422307 RepID=UPI003D668549
MTTVLTPELRIFQSIRLELSPIQFQTFFEIANSTPALRDSLLGAQNNGAQIRFNDTLTLYDPTTDVISMNRSDFLTNFRPYYFAAVLAQEANHAWAKPLLIAAAEILPQQGYSGFAVSMDRKFLVEGAGSFAEGVAVRQLLILAQSRGAAEELNALYELGSLLFNERMGRREALAISNAEILGVNVNPSNVTSSNSPNFEAVQSLRLQNGLAVIGGEPPPPGLTSAYTYGLQSALYYAQGLAVQSPAGPQYNVPYTFPHPNGIDSYTVTYLPGVGPPPTWQNLLTLVVDRFLGVTPFVENSASAAVERGATLAVGNGPRAPSQSDVVAAAGDGPLQISTEGDGAQVVRFMGNDQKDRADVGFRVNDDGSFDDRVWLEKEGIHVAVLKFEGTGEGRELKGVVQHNVEISLEDIGGTFGSALGRALGGNDPVRQVAYGSIAELTLRHLATTAAGQPLSPSLIQTLDFQSGESALTKAAGQSFEDLLGSELFGTVRGQIFGVISAAFMAELADFLDLGDFELIVQSLGTSITNKVLQNAATMAGMNGPAVNVGLLNGVNNVFIFEAVASAGGSFLGGLLASQVVLPDTTEAAIVSAAFSAVGAYVGSILGSAGGPVGTFAGAFAGAFIFQVLGSVLGNLGFGADDDSEAYYNIIVDETAGIVRTELFYNVDGGDYELARTMADLTRDAVNSILNFMDSRIDPAGMSGEKIGTSIDYLGQPLDPDGGSIGKVKIGWGVESDDSVTMGIDTFNISYTYSVNKEQAIKEVVAHAADQILSQLDVSDGNVFLERAFYASRDDGLLQLSTDLEIAKNYISYTENSALINHLMLAETSSSFSLGWLSVLARAQELDLNKAGRADFRDGLPGFLAGLDLSSFDVSSEGDPTLGDVSISPSGDGIIVDIALRATNRVPDRIYHLYGGQAMEVTLPDGSHVLRFMLDAATMARGGFMRSFDGYASNDAGATSGGSEGNIWQVRPQEAGEASQNLWIGDTLKPQNEYRDNHEFWLGVTSKPGQSDLLIGASNKDSIFGGAGRDWIEGGAGDDAIYGQTGDDIIVGGTGNDYMFGDDSTGQTVNGLWVEDLYVAPRGADLFIFGEGSGHDRIRDFDQGLDKILFGMEGMRSFVDIQAHFRWIDPANPNNESVNPYLDANGANISLNATKIVIDPNTTIRIDGIRPDQWISTDFQTRPAPTVSVGNITVAEGTAPPLADGFFRTSGNQIVDVAGNPFRISAVNWFGFETPDMVPHGLYERDWRGMMDQMKAVGFNTIRLPFSSAMLDPDARPTGGTTGGINLHLNDDLLVSGKFDWRIPIDQQLAITSLEIMDRIIDYAGKIGLRIILDHHRSDAGHSANENGLWYTATHTEAEWVADWQMLAKRYAGNPAVIGADLHNEPHGKPDVLYNALHADDANFVPNPTPNPATWGSGDVATDWRLAAEKAGNAIGVVNPDWLIFVEGVEIFGSVDPALLTSNQAIIQAYSDKGYWWGGNLGGVADHPVRLNVPNKLVYSAHDYPSSVYAQTWFSNPSYPDNLPAKFRENWGFIFENGLAPIFIGEIGTHLQDPKDIGWLETMMAYLEGDLDSNGTRDIAQGSVGPGFGWWAWNPFSGDTGGILKDDWRQVETEKLEYLKNVLSFNHVPVGGSTVATFTVQLSSPATEIVTMHYRTAPRAIREVGAAVSGGDFTSIAGTLTFQPGEQSKQLHIAISRDSLLEGNEDFLLVLSDAKNAIINTPTQMLTASATIIDDDAATQPNAPNVVLGDSAANTLQGIDRHNAMYGGGGNDLLVGHQQDDMLAGDADNDVLRGEAGNDMLFGDTGDDTLIGGQGADFLYGGLGAHDTASYVGSTNGVVVNLANRGAQSSGDAQGDVLVGIEDLVGSGFGDVLSGDSLSNRLSGEAGNDTLNGGDGDDILVGGAGGDQLTGGAGVDTASYDTAAAGVVASLASNVANTGEALGDTYSLIENLRGSAFVDTLTGDGLANRLEGLAGDDVLIGGAGADTLDGGSGSFDFASYETATSGVTASLLSPSGNTGDAAGDVYIGIENLRGSAYGDFLYGGAGFNRLEGGNGDDTLAGGAGGDQANGGAGIDTLSYETAAAGLVASLATNASNTGDAAGDVFSFMENLRGSAFADTLSGDAASNVLEGLAGADSLAGADGNDTLIGGAGADTLNGGAGTDTASYDTAAAGVVASLASNVANTGEALGDTYSLIENLRGSAFVDTLTGDGLANRLEGLAGDDVLIGGVGADTLDGGSGGFDFASYETATSGVTASLLSPSGNTGDAAGDVYIGIENLRGSAYGDFLYGGAGFNRLEGGNGDDTLAGGAGGDQANGGAGIDTLSYETAAAGLVASLATNVSNTGDAAGDVFSFMENLRGSAFADTLSGDAASNVLEGLAGADSLAGADGNDTLIGGAGADTLNGGAGTDTASYDTAAAGVVASLASNVANTGEALGDTYSLIENLRGTAFADTLSGDAANNVLEGLAGADSLAGADGNDTLIGGAGADTLNGGAGMDVFRYEIMSDSGAIIRDTILDFSKVQTDRIDLTSIDANETVAGDQAFNFVGSAAFVNDGVARVRYFQSGADTIVEADLGDGVTDFQLQVNGVIAFVAGDFIL